MSVALFLLTLALALTGVTSHSAAQSRRIGSSVYATFERAGANTELIGLAVGDIAPGTKVTINCTGSSCPFTERTLNVAGTVKTLAITDMFIEPVFNPGTILEIRVTRPGMIGKVFQYETQSSGEPRVLKQCLPPDGSKPVAC